MLIALVCSMVVDVSVLHAIAGLHSRSGGTARVVVDITDALAGQPEMAITLLTQAPLNDETLSSTYPIPVPAIDGALRSSIPRCLPAVLDPAQSRPRATARRTARLPRVSDSITERYTVGCALPAASLPAD